MPETTGARPGSGRELHDGLAPEVLRAGPPPVPVLAAPFSARTADPGGSDLDLVHAWMNRPHVAEFFGQAWSRRDWAGELAGQLAGTYSRPFVVARDGTDVGYVELYRAARDVIAGHYPADAGDIGLHIAIGSPGDTGRGLGPAIVGAFARALFAVDPACRRVMLEPDAANRAARSAALRAGMRLLGEIDLPHKRAALFVLPRTEEDVPG
ncbi:RimJ/RimL family protein N-acetyltransferase [Spinactinospora alkalitolerans]|uniref:Lysine N-acyltransferase MbtK n=1 Tax=Spinactinospora alkalitolerans TaxID=687207 RepID=A0A852TVE5_9ACTN|nr:GNAT family N-acetyltransferase [Spinactinospora alkalitolerans]NYE46842.1 RimJ/RimL family protein N-acetyltransferase [Spinactinospora alkalitolerans]